MKDNTKNQTLKLSIFIVLFFFLTLNIISSQTIPSLYFQFINNNRKATVSFLEKIKTFSEFQKILEMNKNIYGQEMENEVFSKEIKRKQTIKNLEQILTKNPKSRDVLYSLYLLYKEDGDDLTAEKYLKQVKEIDPVVR